MNTYTFSNHFKRIKNMNNIRPDIRLISGISLTYLHIKCPSVKDRIIEVLEDKRSKLYKYCYDTVDNIQYLYDLDLFRDTGTQVLKAKTFKEIKQDRSK